MSPLLTLLRKEITLFFRFRSGVIVTFLVPIVLIYIFGWVFGLNKKDFGPSGIPLVVVNQSKDPAALTLIEALRREKTFRVVTEDQYAEGGPRPVTEETARAWLRDNHHRFVLILPEDFLSDQRLGLRLVFLNNPRNEIETLTVDGMLQKTIFSNGRELLTTSLLGNARRRLGEQKFDNYNRSLARLITENFGGDETLLHQRLNAGDYFNSEPFESPAGQAAKPADQGLRRLDTPAAPAPTASPADSATPAHDAGKGAPGKPDTQADSAADMLSRIVAIEKEQVAGKQVKNPAASRLIGGYAIMFLLFAVSGFSTSFFAEKHSGIYQRLLSTRARRHHILLSKFLFCVLLGLFQLSALFLFGNLLYQLDLFAHLLPLAVVALAASAACAAFGMLIASIASNPQAANGLATLLVLTMSAIGGAWFPISFMPEFIQQLATFTVVYWAVEGFTNVLWADFGVVQSLPYIGVLLMMTVVCQGVALWRFRRGDLFS